MVSSLNKAGLRMEVASFTFGLFIYVLALGLCCCTWTSSSSTRASHCGGFSWCGAQTLGVGFSSCSIWAQ